jgi:hypothetical protein
VKTRIRPPLTPAERSTRARIAAYARWGQEDPAAAAARGQAGLRAKFLREVVEAAAAAGVVLTDAERDRRADCRYREHMTRIKFNHSREQSTA